MPVESALGRIEQIRARFDSLEASVRPGVPAASRSTFDQALSRALGASSGSAVGAASSPFASALRPAALSGSAASTASAPINGTEKQLTADQLNGVLQRAGFQGESLRIAWAIVMRESNGQPGLVGPVNGNGTRDYGMFQFNDVHRGSWLDFDRVFDAQYSAEAAFRMSKGGTDFSAWALGDSGWAGQLKERNPDTYQMLYDRWREFYDAYPTSVSAA